MRFKATIAAALVALGTLVSASAAIAVDGHAGHTSAAKTSAAQLNVTLSTLLGEHALLATAATHRGFSGGKDFPALAKELDRNSVELSKAIGSVFGPQAGNRFLNGKLLWRDHIRFFVAYTTAKAKKDTMGQEKAVGELKGYIEAFSSFLSTATGLPKAALRTSITEHVMQLKGSLDAYAAGNYAKAYSLQMAAHDHMVMTGTTLASAIVEKFPSKYDA
jgi:hypothetical protein